MSNFTVTITYADNSTKTFSGTLVTGDSNFVPEVGSHITRKVGLGAIPPLVAPYTIDILVS